MTQNNDSLGISIVIPVYNEEKLIGRCLRALLPQLKKSDEVIIIDNNSKDDTINIVKAIYPEAKIFTEKKQGISYARTLGFDKASCPIIARIDADTIVASNWLSVIRKKFTENPDINAMGGLSGVAEISPDNKIRLIQPSRLAKFIHQKRFNAAPIMFGFNMALTKKTWDQIRPILWLGDDNITEDLDIALAIHKIKGKIVHEPTMLVNIHVGRFFSIKKMLRYRKSDIKTIEKYRNLRP